jgi:hypothetical protein
VNILFRVLRGTAEQFNDALTQATTAHRDYWRQTDFADNPAPGNLRADYVLPSRQLKPLGAGVFWPVRADPLSRLTGEFPFPTSDHRLVWVDVRVPGWH